MKKSRLGELYEVNETKANRWCVVLLTVDDCNSLLEKCGGEHRVRKINTAEKALIKLCRSCLNVMSSDDSTPLPKHYKQPDSWLAGT